MVDLTNPYKKMGGGALDQQLFQKHKASPVPTGAPTPSPAPRSIKMEQKKQEKRKQISAHVTQEQLLLLRQLHFSLNTGEVTIEKSEIIGLGVELIAKVLGTHVPEYANVDDLRKYLHTQVAKYLGTQAP